MKPLVRPTRLLLLTACGLLLAGCNLPQPQADTVRYFTLGGPVGATSAEGATVRPVQLAGHLHNRAMAVRIADHEVIYLDDVRWAESLDNAITQLLRARCGTSGGGSVINVQVQRCELVRSEGNSIQLVATYTIVPATGDKTAARPGNFSASARTWDGKDYGTLVGLLRDAVGELGDTLAKAVVPGAAAPQK
jgi:uncharacterized lipoprotein YmbA